jgi:hypothetical protein
MKAEHQWGPVIRLFEGWNGHRTADAKAGGNSMVPRECGLIFITYLQKCDTLMQLRESRLECESV